MATDKCESRVLAANDKRLSVMRAKQAEEHDNVCRGKGRRGGELEVVLRGRGTVSCGILHGAPREI